MFGLDPAHFVEVPESEACRLAERGCTVARFRFVGDADGDPAAVTRVHVVDAGDRCVLRYRGPTREVRVVTREALPHLAAHLLGGAPDEGTADGPWVLDCEGPWPDWATRPA